MTAVSDQLSAVTKLSETKPGTKSIFASCLATIFLATAPVVEAQQAVKIPRIGFLEASSASTIAVRLEAFRQELRRLGWIEEKTITIE
jgi:hypothetical protein